MSGIQKLHLEDAFDDTPQIRSYVQLFENDAELLSTFSTDMKSKCDQLTNILLMLSACTKDISNHMKSYKNLNFSICGDETVLIDNMETASSYMDKHSENQQRLAEDLNCGMMFSLDRFIQIDLSEVFRLGNMYKMLSNEHEQSLSRYLKLSTRRDNANTFKVAQNDLLNMKKKYHQTTLAYFSSLNCLQHHRKLSLLQPLLSYLRYSSTGNGPSFTSSCSSSTSTPPCPSVPNPTDATNIDSTTSTPAKTNTTAASLSKPSPSATTTTSKDPTSASDKLPATSPSRPPANGGDKSDETTGETDQLKEFLSNCESGLEEVQLELNSMNKEQKDKCSAISQTTDYGCLVTTGDVTNHCRVNLTQKQGYLYLRSKHALMASKWERSYFFVQSGNMMCQHKNELAGSLLIDLSTNEYQVSITQIDDRNHCLKIYSPKTKRTIILQAENELEQREWVATLQNVMKEYEAKISIDSQQSNNPPTVRSLPQGSSISMADSSSGSVGSGGSPCTPTIGGATTAASAHSSPAAAHASNTKSPRHVTNAPASPASISLSTNLAGSSSFSLTDAPIQFDLAHRKDEIYASVDFQQRRVNPFDESPDTIMTASICSSSSAGPDNNSFLRSFVVRFIGCMQVQQDRGDQLIYETMRQIMVTRAMHNIFKTSEFRLLISSESMRIIDQSNNSVRRGFMLQNISYWTSHNENKRLFGFITCNQGSEDNVSTYNCHVFECDSSADEICHSISTATKLAYEIMINESNRSENVDDSDSLSQLTADETDDHANSAQNHPMREVQGDERRIEGAESDT